MKKTKTNSQYPKSLKRKVAREYLEGKFSYSVAAEEYGLKNKDVVKEFVRWYKKSLYLESMESKGPNEESLTQGCSAVSPGQELGNLEQALAAAQLKIASLETLIDVAEQELSIDIRKKSGTKQSK